MSATPDPNELVAIHHPVTKQDSVVTRFAFDGAWEGLGWQIDTRKNKQPDQPVTDK